MRHPWIWAHRGASGYAPENTLEAFALAAAQKADGAELDVQLTKDGEMVVIHDERVDRTTDGIGYVRDFTLAQLKKLNAGKAGTDWPNAKIPTLQEVYELLRETDLTINTEMKTGIFFYEGMEDRVLDLAARMGLEDRIWYSSFNHYTVRSMKEKKPDIRMGVLYEDGIYEAPSYAAGLGADALHPALYNVQYPDYMKKARENGLRVHVWTVNEEAHIRKMCGIGVDAVITNYPDRARQVRAEQQGFTAG